MENQNKLSKGCRIWFWFVLVMNCFSLLASFAVLKRVPSAGAVSLIGAIGMIVGSGLILFKNKKIGLYILIAVAVIGFVFNLSSGIKLSFSLLFSLVNPIVSFMFVDSNSTVIK